MTGHNAFKTEVLADGFEYLEGPRWRDGRLWMSDSFGGQVFTVGADGGVETVVEVPGMSAVGGKADINLGRLVGRF